MALKQCEIRVPKEKVEEIAPIVLRILKRLKKEEASKGGDASNRSRLTKEVRE